MTRRVCIRTSALLVALLASSVTTPVAADDAKKEAQVLYDMAMKQAESGDTAAAVSSFRASYDKHPSYRVLYQLGKSCARAGDAPCAVRAYEQYLSDGGSAVPSKRKKEVEAQIKALSRTLARITISANVKGAEVSVDDVVVGTTPLPGPVPVGGGAHRISLSHEGGKVDKSVTAVAGESATVAFDVKKDEAAPAPPPPEAKEPEPEADEPSPPPKAAKPEEERSFPVVPWAVTGTLAAATVVTGILASSAYGSYKDKLETYPVSRNELDDAQGSARDLFVLSSVLGAGTVISLGIASYFTFFGSSPSSGGPPPSKARVGFAIAPTGVAIHGVTW